MRNLLILLVLMYVAASVTAQVKAVTEHGDTIYVYQNGTWSFDLEDNDNLLSLTDKISYELQIDTVKALQKFSEDANKSISTSIGQFELKYNEKDWKRVPPGKYNEDAEFAFEHRRNDVLSVIITEQAEFDKEAIFKIALNTMEENIGAKPKVLKTELRNVNGFDILRGVVEVEMTGVALVFDTYYYGNEKGTTQFTVWTAKSLWEKYEQAIIEFQNGLVIK